MKSHYWQYLIDRSGSPIEGATIHVYLAGTTTYANIFYPNSDSSKTTSLDTAITTDSNGYFHFWVADVYDDATYGYPNTQLFKLTWAKAGINPGSVDNVQILELDYAVDTTDTNANKNKRISNYLGNLWETHRTTDIRAGGTTIVHGIEQVNELSTDIIKNKLVSNWQMYQLQDLIDSIGEGGDSSYLLRSGTTTLTGHWDIGAGKIIRATNLRARSAEGIYLYNYLGTGGVYVQDSGQVAMASVDIDGGAIDSTSIGSSTPAAGRFTTLTTIGGGVTIASGYQLTVSLIAPATGALTIKSSDGTTAIDVGSTGIVTIPTVAIESGSINQTTIGAVTPSAGYFTTCQIAEVDIDAGTIDRTLLGYTWPVSGAFNIFSCSSVDIDGGYIDNTEIGATSVAPGTFSHVYSPYITNTRTTSEALTGVSVSEGYMMYCISGSDYPHFRLAGASDIVLKTITDIPTVDSLSTALTGGSDTVDKETFVYTMNQIIDRINYVVTTLRDLGIYI